MRIVSLEASNVKRLRAVEITLDPAEPLVVIGGRNEAGKSSLLDGITMALAGARYIPERPLRKGARNGKMRIALDEEGLVVERTFTDAGSTLTVSDTTGKRKSPQAILDTWAFDPEEYCSRPKAERAEILRRLTGLDLSDVDAKMASAFERRKEVNRDAKRLRAVVDSLPATAADVPADEVSVAELTAELERRQAAADARTALCRASERADGDVTVAEQAAQRAKADLEAAQRKADAARLAVEEAVAARAIANTAYARNTPPLPATEIREQLKTVEARNAQVRAAKARTKAEAEATTAERSAKGLTKQLEDLDEERRARIAAAKMPIDGLGFDSDGVVTLDGLPLDQASQAKKILVGAAIHLALKPRIGVLLVRDGSHLDDENLRALGEFCTAHGAQAWVERVGTGPECSVVISDGMCVEVNQCQTQVI